MNQYFDNETPAIDYSIEHAQEIATATAEMGSTPAVPTGANLPQSLVHAIIDGNPTRVLTTLGKLPAGVVNDRDGSRLALTPLHMVALLYAYQKRQHHDLEAVRYDTICQLLMFAGANPLARAYLPGDSIPYYPAQFAKGMTPPSLRRRMLRETAKNHVGWQPDDGRLRSVNQRTQASIQRQRRACTARGWVNERQAVA